MNTKNCFRLLIVLCLAAFVAAGCSKKRTDMPPGATKVEVVEEDTSWQTSDISEDQLRAQQKAQAAQELRNMIHFAFDSSELTSDSRDVLQVKADILNRYPEMTMVIEGYCDERGTVEYNLALGERRARSAYEYLVILGVGPERMSIVSFGEENPIDPSSNESAWAMNRRDQFRIIQ